MNKQVEIARLIEALAREMIDAAYQMHTLISSGNALPGEIQKLLVDYVSAVQLIKVLLRSYVADDEVAEELLDQGLFNIALKEILALNAISGPLPGADGE